MTWTFLSSLYFMVGVTFTSLLIREALNDWEYIRRENLQFGITFCCVFCPVIWPVILIVACTVGRRQDAA